MTEMGGSIRTQVSLSAADFAALRDWDMKASDVLREAVERLRGEKTPQLQLAELDRTEAQLREKRLVLEARVRRVVELQLQEKRFDELVALNVRKYPQIANANATLVKALWGHVIEHEVEFSLLMRKYSTGEAIKNRVCSAWSMAWLRSQSVPSVPEAVQ